MTKYIFLLAVLFSAGAYAQHKNQNSFTLKGHISDAPKTKIYLEEAKKVSGILYQDSTVTDEAGYFSIRGHIPESRLFNLRIEGRKQMREMATLYLENNSVVSLKGNADSLYKAEITGSADQALLNTFVPEFNKNLAAITAKLYKPYQAAKAKNDSTAMLREGGIADKKVIDGVSEMIAGFVSKHPSSALSLELLETLMKYNRIATADSLMRLIEKTPAGKYELGLKLRKELDIHRRLIVGAIAPDFFQQDTSGRRITLSSLRGKYVLIDFWASWCGPCRAENPNVLQAYQKFKNQNFTILAISMDKDKKSWVKAIQEDQLPWLQVSDLKGFDNQAGKLYAVNAIPMNYLIDPSGKIIALNLRGENLHQTLQEHLK